jgi:hypothetical protein
MLKAHEGGIGGGIGGVHPGGPHLPMPLLHLCTVLQGPCC